MGAPGLDFETWESSNLNPPARRKLPGNDLAEVSNPGEPFQRSVDQPQMRAPHNHIRIEHHHLVEEGVDHGPQRGDQNQRLTVCAFLTELCNLRRKIN